MSGNLSASIAAYFSAANDFDISGVSTYFSQDAVVKDEKRERHGVEKIRAWMMETGEEYGAVSEVISAVPQGDTVVVSAKVSGSFPGIPITLQYTFTLRDERIDHLEIH